MMRTPFKLVAIGACIGSIALLASCGNNEEAAIVDYSAATIIDVRAADEYAAGHLAGAVNHNVEDGSLESALASLDPEASYVVYCRSGRRSEIAAEIMKTNGFAQVADLGSLEDAADASGLAIVTD
jgi:rhodanese-related sulfurtransferase